MDYPRVVVVGAGFGGLTVARALSGEPVTVTVVERHNYHGFWPLLYQVATAGLGAEDIAQNLRGILQRAPNVDAHLSTVTGFDLDARLLLLEDAAPLAYDFLVVAPGSVSADFGVPGVREHALSLKTLDDALRIRTTVLEQFEEANAAAGALDRNALTVAVVGGGPTGVELCGALAELFTKVLSKDFKRVDVAHAHVVLVEMSDAVLPGYSDASRAEALRALRSRGVEVQLGAGVTSVDAKGISLADGSRVDAPTVVWTAGVEASPLAEELGAPRTRGGRVEVGPDLSLPGHPEVFVIGDLAAARAPGGALYPQLAPVAMQGARHAARSILRTLAGRRRRRFRYVDKGTMATIGRRAAVADLPGGVRLRGTLGWLSWLGLHLLYLVGFRNRAVVLVNWAWNYARWERGNRIIVDEPPRAAAGAGRR